ncbi:MULTISPECIES: SGNH/GDSL hydrolase family protein [Okeania]|uniref:GDSL family lipase n=1 Tax=Okeania hirsuta TaxID=1458930 RepID=A0A3N6P5P1_9CYAN|nr:MULTISPECIES: SGNH/GDSL hydrolase family protein [Okeania]NET15370.1 SGNH/GDSL hydrolase family protein [Okeania sp. SIO1H6]NES79662.1 SGNH/GDSL hydrolase family protein [Okeania sp. SIO1H4]NES91412.1 SGNH/GDSL hydrolase family protein [Okeania sp. SIO2B9]NET23318.1 SGNH/GDSL hydrolase family protein [Okeania sp. SIO1H5]NET80047.1 SGNH/GDSL hydrolase family protein [Okeania sp. SIO1F9]
MALTINELFDEQFYLETYPGVAEAVANGTVSNGFFHFIRFGQFESRDPNAIFNTNFYLANNPGVAAAVEQNLLTPTEHFINFGQFEQRNPSTLLDTSFYLDRYSDVAEALVTTSLTATEHFLNAGQFEGRLPRSLFSDIYVFGDSLSDTGNAFVATGGLLPPSPPYFQGRTSNGPLWIETLAPQLELTSNSSLNFAVNGATTGFVNNTNNLLPEGTPPLLIGLQTQIDNFIAETPETDPDALYVVWAGANDYLGGSTQGVQSSVGNLSVAVNKLASIGARNFLLPNLPDLGLTPFGQSLPPEQQQGLSLLSEGHNSGLAAASQILEQDPNINIISPDFKTIVDNIIANPTDFGFTNVTDNFLASGAINPDDFLFFDNIHPTTNGHNFLADTAIKSITEISELVSILEASEG